MDHIGRVLPAVLGRRGLTEQARAALVVHKASLWIGQQLPDLASLLAVEKLQDGILHLTATHSVAAQEAHAATPGLLDYLRQNCKFTDVTAIRLVRK